MVMWIQMGPEKYSLNAGELNWDVAIFETSYKERYFRQINI
jgi:hypothetical protein